MRHRIFIENHTDSFEAGEAQSVLDQGLAAGVSLAHGCKAGGCGACAAQVIRGSYRLEDTPALAPKEREAGHVLLCRTHAQSDLLLRFPDQSSQDHIAQIAEILYPNIDVAVLRLQMAQPLRFTAGQSVRILLKDGTARSYSIASDEQDGRTLELHIRHLPGGRCSSRFFGTSQAIRVGMKIRLRGPMGGFALQPGAGPKLLLATGTGYAPLRSMLLTLLRNRPLGKVVLYWGAKSLEDIYARNEAQALIRELNGRFVPVVSSPSLTGSQVPKGYVQDAALLDFKCLSDAQVYACGSTAMIEAARRVLTIRAGLPAESFFADAFLAS